MTLIEFPKIGKEARNMTFMKFPKLGKEARNMTLEFPELATKARNMRVMEFPKLITETRNTTIMEFQKLEPRVLKRAIHGSGWERDSEQETHGGPELRTEVWNIIQKLYVSKREYTGV